MTTSELSAYEASIDDRCRPNKFRAYIGYTEYGRGQAAILIIAPTARRAKALAWQYRDEIMADEFTQVRVKWLKSPGDLLEREGIDLSKERVRDTGVTCRGCDLWLHQEPYTDGLCYECYDEVNDDNT